MEIIVDNLWSQIETDNPDLLKALRELYTYPIPGAAFSPAMKRGQWDGKKSFITLNGKFRTGLLSRVYADLKRIGCEPKVNHDADNFTWGPLCVNKEIGEYTLRDYQLELVKRSLTKRRAIVDAPTGAGKTLIMASILQELAGKKTLILFHQKQILKQTYDFFKACGLEDLGLCFGEGFIQGRVMLCTIKSIEKILDTHLDADVLMIDEVHEFASGKETIAAIQGFDNALYRLGFTATVPKDPIKLLTLEGALGPKISEVSTKDLVERGDLAKPIIQIITQEYPTIVTGISYSEIYDKYIVNSLERNKKIQDIIYHIKDNDPSAKVMILVKNIDHVTNLTSLIDCYSLQGKDDIKTRYNTIKKFLADKFSVIIGTKIFQTGINIEEITHFILARGLKSEEATLQAIGRSLRRNQEKVYIYDFLDKGIKYLEKHSKTRIKIYKEEGHDVTIL